MRCTLHVLAISFVACAGALAPACTVAGLTNGVRTAEAGASSPEGGGGIDGAVPPACAADLTQDKANCGRCGRVCTGPCDQGTCDVTTMAEGQPTIVSLAASGSFVAWGTPRSLRYCAAQGCTTPSLYDVNVDLTGQVVLDGPAMVFTTGPTSSHGVNRCVLPDCNDVSLGYNLGTPNALAVDQGETFVLEEDGRRVIHDPCGGSCAGDVAENTPADGAIALGLSNVYWSVLTGSPGIYSCPRSGCPGGVPGVFAVNVTMPRSLAVDLREVRWTSYDGGTVSSCPLAGCDGAPRVLARDQKNPLGIASDGTRIYWANEGDGTVVSCDDACASGPEVMVRGLARPQWVALDATYVYFSTATGLVGRTLK